MMRWFILSLFTLFLVGCEFLSGINTTQFPEQTRGVVNGVPFGARHLKPLQKYGIVLADSRDGTHIIIPADKLFAETIDRVTINPNFQQPLNELIHVLKGYPKVNLTIVGHTDGVASAALEKKKSSEYAYAVANYLTSAGISPTRIVSVQGVGDREPIDRNNDLVARAINRRVEIIADQPIQ
jgi:outer membrane protein OmpA-like peptidoglycan-associated protein